MGMLKIAQAWERIGGGACQGAQVAALDNVVRGDKGVRARQLLSGHSFFLRSARLMRTQIPTVVLAVVALSLVSGARLFMPNYTGPSLPF